MCYVHVYFHFLSRDDGFISMILSKKSLKVLLIQTVLNKIWGWKQANKSHHGEKQGLKTEKLLSLEILRVLTKYVNTHKGNPMYFSSKAAVQYRTLKAPLVERDHCGSQKT